MCMRSCRMRGLRVLLLLPLAADRLTPAWAPQLLNDCIMVCQLAGQPLHGAATAALRGRLLLPAAGCVHRRLRARRAGCCTLCRVPAFGCAAAVAVGS
jgi:hypothetical protein